MSGLIWSFAFSFALSAALGPFIIPWLKRKKIGQTIYELGPHMHLTKQGIPTMGGLIFVIPMLIMPVLMLDGYANLRHLLIPLAATAGFGSIGFIDDWIIVVRKRSLGLTPKQKLLAQVFLSAALAIWAHASGQAGSAIAVPFTAHKWDLGWFFIPVMMFIMVATVNSANLMDGLDGLLAGCSALDFAALAALFLGFASQLPGEAVKNYIETALFACCAAGSLLGYLLYNNHPAGVIMGDVGSFAIGGALAGLCLVTGLSLVLPIIGICMVATAVSDLIQFAYYRATKGKRVFRMAPLHHHFELGGTPETRIVSLYMIATAVTCALTLLWVA
jgi:phospho-N-acetylmuramoyl-pentapeptide-transferase